MNSHFAIALFSLIFSISCLAASIAACVVARRGAIEAEANLAAMNASIAARRTTKGADMKLAFGIEIPDGYGYCFVCGIVPMPPNDTGCDHTPPFVIQPISTP